jgi:hypothetical protein
VTALLPVEGATRELKQISTMRASHVATDPYLICMMAVEQLSSFVHWAVARLEQAVMLLGPESVLASAGPTKLGGALQATPRRTKAAHPG